MPLTLPSFSGTKEIYHESVFQSFVVRWVWRFYTQRLTQAGRWFLWPTLIFTSYGSTAPKEVTKQVLRWKERLA